MQEIRGNVEKSVKDSHSGRTGRLTKYRAVTSVTPNLPDLGPRLLLLLLVLAPQSRKESEDK